MNQSRSDALKQIRVLAAQHDLSPADIAAALSSHEHEAGDRSRVLVRVLSYLGAIFVFAGIGTFVAINWHEFNSPARVIVSLGSGLVIFTLALIAVRDERYEAVATPLFIVAAALLPAGLLVLFNEYSHGGDGRVAAMVTSATVALQYGLTFVKLRRMAKNASTVLAFFAIFFAAWFWAVALDKIGLEPAVTALTMGAMLVVLAIPVRRGDYHAISPALFLAGSWAFLYGLFDIVQHHPLEIVFLIVACAFVYLGVRLRSRMLNFTSTAAILAYSAYFTAEHFGDSVGWPLAMIAFGLVMIGVSAIALRIDRKYIRQR